MSAEIRISIGIPTYNGEEYLSEAIESVTRQLSDVPRGIIEILISDNASSDRTGEIAKVYVSKYPGFVRYVRNESNVGYDRNVDNLFKCARGEYLWTLGDDDFLLPGALRKLLSVIDTNCDVAVFCLAISFLDISDGKRHSNQLFNADVLCSDGDDFLQRTLWGTSALSSLCIRKDSWNNESLEKYIGSHWIHVGGMLEIMRHKVKGFIVADEMAVVRVQNPRWNEHFGDQLEVGLNHLKIFENVNQLGYNKKTFNVFLEGRYANNLIDILIRQPKHINSRIKVARLMVHFFKDRVSFWLIHMPLLLVPKIITDLLINFGRRLARMFD